MRTASPTSISKFEACPRKWAAGYLFNRWPPQTAAQLRGIEAHDDLEKWGRLGIEPGPDRLLRFALPTLRAEIPDRSLYQWETWGEVELEPDLGIHGKLDIVRRGPDGYAVLDLKTHSSFRWAVGSAAELENDLQMLVYAANLAADLDPDTPIEIAHIQLESKPPHETRVVRATVRAGDALERVRDRYTEPARAMRDAYLRHATDGTHWADHGTPDGAPNAPACFAYGGCPYRPDCIAVHSHQSLFTGAAKALTKGFQMSDIFGKSQEIVIARTKITKILDQCTEADREFFVATISEKLGESNLDEIDDIPILEMLLGAVEHWPTAPSPGEVDRWLALVPPSVAATARAQRTSDNPGDRRAIAADCFSSLVTLSGDPSSRELDLAGWEAVAAATKPAAVNPPDAAPDGPLEQPDPAFAHVETVDGIGKTLVDRLANYLDVHKDDLTVGLVASRAGTPTAAGAMIANVSGLSASKLESILTVAGVGTTDAPAPASPKPRPTGDVSAERAELAGRIRELEIRNAMLADRVAEPDVTRSGFDLYVNALPHHNGQPVRVTSLAEWLRPLERKICAEYGAPHFTLLEYGKGPGTLAALAAHTIEQDDGPSGAVVAIGLPYSYDEAIAALARHANVYVRGIK